MAFIAFTETIILSLHAQAYTHPVLSHTTTSFLKGPHHLNANSQLLITCGYVIVDYNKLLAAIMAASWSRHMVCFYNVPLHESVNIAGLLIKGGSLLA